MVVPVPQPAQQQRLQHRLLRIREVNHLPALPSQEIPGGLGFFLVDEPSTGGHYCQPSIHRHAGKRRSRRLLKRGLGKRRAPRARTGNVVGVDVGSWEEPDPAQAAREVGSTQARAAVVGSVRPARARRRAGGRRTPGRSRPGRPSSPRARGHHEDSRGPPHQHLPQARDELALTTPGSARRTGRPHSSSTQPPCRVEPHSSTLSPAPVAAALIIRIRQTSVRHRHRLPARAMLETCG